MGHTSKNTLTNNDVYDAKKCKISLGLGNELACLLVQRHTDSFLLDVRLSLHRRSDFLRFMQETMSLFGTGQLPRTNWLRLDQFYLLLQMVESRPVLLRHLEEVVVLVC
jgi:hypothetical protein